MQAFSCHFFIFCSVIQRQLACILGRQQIVFDLEEDGGFADMMEHMRNTQLNTHFLNLAREVCWSSIHLFFYFYVSIHSLVNIKCFEFTLVNWAGLVLLDIACQWNQHTAKTAIVAVSCLGILINLIYDCALKVHKSVNFKRLSYFTLTNKDQVNVVHDLE